MAVRQTTVALLGMLPYLSVAMVELDVCPAGQSWRTGLCTSNCAYTRSNGYCTLNNDKIKAFVPPSGSDADAVIARDLCEEFCTAHTDCWGCSIATHYIGAQSSGWFQWNAIESCGTTVAVEAKIEGYVTEKPATVVACRNCAAGQFSAHNGDECVDCPSGQVETATRTACVKWSRNSTKCDVMSNDFTTCLGSFDSSCAHGVG